MHTHTQINSSDTSLSAGATFQQPLTALFIWSVVVIFNQLQQRVLIVQSSFKSKQSIQSHNLTKANNPMAILAITPLLLLNSLLISESNLFKTSALKLSERLFFLFYFVTQQERHCELLELNWVSSVCFSEEIANKK